MYTKEDLRSARSRLRKCAAWIVLVALPLLALYVLALAKRSYALSAVTALLLFFWLLFMGDLKLAPLLRYRRFLRDMNSGLRRKTACVIVRLDGEIQHQDGAQVRPLHVRLPDGDSRIFYLNASKVDFLPLLGSSCTLVSFGRHAVEFTVD